MTEKAARYESDARDAVKAGRDDLAQQALALKATVQQQLDAVKQHITELDADVARLLQAQHAMEMKVENFRAQKESMKAQYTASKAEVHIGETLNGLSKHDQDVTAALERARDKTEAMRARAAAIETLEQQGALGPAAGDPDANIHAQLESLKQTDDIQAELARLKAEVGKPQLPEQGS